MKIKNKISYVVNIVLLIAVIVMIISSVIISKDLFSFFNYKISNIAPWRIVHIVSAVTILICVFIHILLHATMLLSLLNRKVQAPNLRKLVKAGSILFSLILMAAVVKVSYHYITHIVTDENGKPKNEEATNSEETTQNEAAKDETDTGETTANETTVEESQSDEDVPTLEEYLRNLFCNGCGRHCSLLLPQCRRGENNARVAEAEYYSTYEEFQIN